MKTVTNQSIVLNQSLASQAIEECLNEESAVPPRKSQELPSQDGLNYLEEETTAEAKLHNYWQMVHSFHDINDHTSDQLRTGILPADLADLNDVQHCTEYARECTASMLRAINLFSDEIPQ